MMKYLLVMLVVMIAIGIWRNKRRSAPPRTPAPPPQPQPHGQTLPRPQAMVTCAHCGVHLPQGDAHAQGTHAPAYYCSDAHRLLGPR